ncbi:acetyl esterase/lipase [Mesorhizobium soli]|uniref:alpha/beta hydrolase n=1 Tax=Pseudaminobacter soli (ex Li et al. 2025) TaxID=1295366 RepID=UPI002475F499|nr:alpha/beta hydrolase [Mesorhizobium soli]MDH6233322.1 acetyl esterase/lipase [Mesorhizobium soli]
MTKNNPYDPQLAAILPWLVGNVPVKMTLEQLPHFRAISSVTREEFLQDSVVSCVEHTAPTADGTNIEVSVVTRHDHHTPGPGIFFLHGGGMVMGSRFSGARPLIEWALKYDAVCVTPEYRLAPEHPAPTPVEDCYAALKWMMAHAKELKFDPARVVIFGGSGGGGLAAGTTLIVRDRKEFTLIGQLLQCPMIDDRNSTPSALEFDGFGVWDTTSNKTAWRAVLGDRCGSANVCHYSAPARTPSFDGLPPTFIDVGAAEVFRDEAIAYARGIMASGGDCELHVWGGAFHGFYDIVPEAAVSRACLAARETWLERILKLDGSMIEGPG